MEILKTKEFWYFLIPVLSGFVIYFLGKNKKAERKHLLILFRANQKLSKKIQEELAVFIEEFDASNAIAFPERNITYGECLDTMSEEYKLNLSDEQFGIIRRRKLSKPTLLSLTASLEKQNEALRLLEIDMKMVIKKVRKI